MKLLLNDKVIYETQVGSMLTGFRCDAIQLDYDDLMRLVDAPIEAAIAYIEIMAMKTVPPNLVHPS